MLATFDVGVGVGDVHAYPRLPARDRRNGRPRAQRPSNTADDSAFETGRITAGRLFSST
jgi:hypothetical protein